MHKLQQIKHSPQDHPWGHTKIQKAEPADPSNARSEFRGSSGGVPERFCIRFGYLLWVGNGYKRLGSWAPDFVSAVDVTLISFVSHLANIISFNFLVLPNNVFILQSEFEDYGVEISK